jgi:hypothetical protein
MVTYARVVDTEIPSHLDAAHQNTNKGALAEEFLPVILLYGSWWYFLKYEM